MLNWTRFWVRVIGIGERQGNIVAKPRPDVAGSPGGHGVAAYDYLSS